MRLSASTFSGLKFLPGMRSLMMCRPFLRCLWRAWITTRSRCASCVLLHTPILNLSKGITTHNTIAQHSRNQGPCIGMTSVSACHYEVNRGRLAYLRDFLCVIKNLQKLVLMELVLVKTGNG
jgi:hypothetical protein